MQGLEQNLPSIMLWRRHSQANEGQKTLAHLIQHREQIRACARERGSYCQNEYRSACRVGWPRDRWPTFGTSGEARI